MIPISKSGCVRLAKAAHREMMIHKKGGNARMAAYCKMLRLDWMLTAHLKDLKEAEKMDLSTGKPLEVQPKNGTYQAEFERIMKLIGWSGGTLAIAADGSHYLNHEVNMHFKAFQMNKSKK